MATINGTEAGDTLVGTAEDDEIDGLGGDDTIYASGGNDTVDGGAGNDVINGGSGNDWLAGGDGHDRLTGGDGNDILLGGEGANEFEPGTGLDQVFGGSNFDDIFLSAPVEAGEVFDGGAEFDTLWLQAFDAGQTLTYELGDVTLTGIERLRFRTDSTSLTIVNLRLGQVVDDVNAGVIPRLQGGGGSEQVFLSTLGSAGTTFTMPNLLVLDFEWFTAFPKLVDLVALKAATSEDYTLSAREGFAARQMLVGNEGNDTLFGSSASDFLIGNGGNDTFHGNGGGDSMSGGAGDDVYHVGHEFDSPNETAGEGVDRILASVSVGLSQANEIEFLSTADHAGTAAIDLAGNELANVITGNAGDNVLDGRAGDDTLNGGRGGIDTVTGGQGSDLLVVDWSDATTNVTTTFAALVIDPLLDLDNATPAELAAWSAGATEGIYRDGSGRSVDFNGIERYDITTGSGHDHLYAGGGIVRTGDGYDVVQALAGPLEVHGGDGWDRFVSGTGADVFDGGDGNDTIDYALASAGIALALAPAGEASFGPGGDELHSVENIAGTAFDDALTGNDEGNSLDGRDGDDVLEGQGGNDTLYGGAGSDTLRGGAGDDSYHISDSDDLVIELAGEGRDTLYVSVSYVLAADAAVEHVWLGSGSFGGPVPALDFTGSDFGQIVDGNAATNVLEGMGGNDWLRGLGGNDVLAGGAGGDTLDGGAGADTMSGGDGNDTYVVDNPGDTVTEAAGGGDGDTIEIATSFTLGAHLENLRLTGSAAVNGTGNALFNVIEGNAAANVLNGGAGADALIGGGGDDWYYVDSFGETVIEAAGEGADRVFASTGYALTAGAFVELLTTTNTAGTSSINLTGNALAQTIYGNAGANVLNGGGGADVLVGLGGDDWYHVDHAGDVVSEGSGGGTTDRIYASVSYTMGAGVQVERLLAADAAATAALNLSGNELGNVIWGNAGANVLDGRAGNDVLVGLAGNDTLVGGLGNDTMTGGTGDDLYYVDSAGDAVFEVAGEGADRILSSISYTLGASVQVETLTTSSNAGTAAIALAGNGIANTIFGNAGANLLDGRAGNDTLVGLAGNDTLVGGTGDDTLSGGLGDDLYYVDSAGDAVLEVAGQGSDRVLAAVSYTLGASAQVETLTTTDNNGTAAIALTGNGIANTIYGNAGANLLDGKGGNDILVGLAGADTFAFTTALGAGNIDTVSGFSVADDTIVLENAVFTGLAAGALAAGAFNTGAAATQADDRIVYNPATGALLFDADGLGGAAGVQFATLAAGLAPTSADFVVV